MEVLTKINILLGSVVLSSASWAILAVIGYAFWSGWQVFQKARQEFQSADEQVRERICDLFESSEEAIWVQPPFLETRCRCKLPPDSRYLFVAEIDGVTRYVPMKDLLRALKQREHTKA
jgi:hypothetical protein